MVLHNSLPWFPVKASALIVAFLQTARTSALSPSPENLSPVHRYREHTDIIYTVTHSAQPCTDDMMLRYGCFTVNWWPGWLFFSHFVVSTHLPDVLHLIVKVIDRPLSRHHFLLSVRARPLHYAVHFGPMMLQRGLWHPIGHVSEVLRETGSHRSGFCSHPPTEADLVIVFVYLCASLCARSHLQLYLTMCFCVWKAHPCICALDQVFPALLLLSTGNRRLGTDG